MKMGQRPKRTQQAPLLLFVVVLAGSAVTVGRVDVTVSVVINTVVALQGSRQEDL
jgi:hypothetical protein